MDTKMMSIADLNLVFGKNEDPLLRWVDEIVLPALQSGIIREASRNTKYVFLNTKLEEISEDNYVIRGIIIKDTILDVNSVYTEGEGLLIKDEHIKSSPYSVFILYLKNHRIALVKNQNGSPNIRNFGAALKDVIKEYTARENKIRMQEKRELLPFSILNITGIKTTTSVKNALRGVKKVNEMTLKFYPLNAEWDGSPLFGILDEQFRKVLDSNNGKMTFNSPKSIKGVTEIAEKAEGYAKVQLTVEYPGDNLLGGKRKVTIRDNMLSENTNIDIDGELSTEFDEIHNYCQEKESMTKVTPNTEMDYKKFIARRKRR